MKPAVVILSLLFASTAPFLPAAAADEAAADPIRAGIAAILELIGADDRAGVAAAVDYPLRYWHEGEVLFTVGNPADFLANYDTLMPDAYRAALLALDAADYARFTQGVMIGAGEIWFTDDAAMVRTFNAFETAPRLIGAPFADAYRQSKALGLAEFEWQGERYTTD